MSRRFCFALDLKNDPALIAEYRKYHEKIWPEITQSLKDCGMEVPETYLLDTRMFMIMEVDQSFSFEKPRPMSKIEDSHLGAAHVEIPASVAGSKAKRKMDTPGTYFSTGTLAGETH